MVDATDLKSVGPSKARAGSSPAIGTLSGGPPLAAIDRLATIRTNPDAFGVVDIIVARTAVRAHRKHSSAPAGYFAFCRGRVLRDFITLVFLTHTFLIRLRWVGLQ